MIKRTRLLPVALSAALFALAAAAAVPGWAREPILICETATGVCSGFGKDGIIDFANDYKNNPRDVTLDILGHPFGFNVTPDSCGATCTILRFTSAEMGIDRTFTGGNTAAVTDEFLAFVKSEEFLKPFIRLINSGAGAQITGTPVGAVGTMTKAVFQDVLFSNVRTMEQKESKAGPAGQDPTISTSFGQFNDSGFKGSVLSVSPGFGLDFGERKDRHLKFSIPISQISVEGLKTFRAGLITQYLHPVYYKDNLTLTVGPGLSYIGMGSLDLPNFSGVVGGALSATLNKDWTKPFATLGAYFGHFSNLGGIDTDISANVYGWGAQTGWRFTRRTVGTVYLVGIQQRAAGFDVSTYHTIGATCSYKILNKFDITFGLSKMFGLRDKKFVDYGLGSAWFF